MKDQKKEEEDFLKNVATHEMKIIRDDGVARHIRFKRPNTGCMHFDLITWPGYLCYTGDMGTYVFSRIEDMFEFFRTDRDDYNFNLNGLSINPSYWGEKLQAIDKNDGFKQYSPDKFHLVVNDIIDRHIADEGLTDEQAESLREAIEEYVFANNDESEEMAHAAAREFEHEGFEFSDFWEHDLKDYSFRFMWCCYALAWGIKKYDEAKVLAQPVQSRSAMLKP